MAPVVTIRGSRSAVFFYKALKRELVLRVERGIGAVRSERFRLLWDNIAIWYDIYSFFNRFAEEGVSFPVDTYTSIWSGEQLDEYPPRSIARAYSDIYLNRGMTSKVDLMTRMIQRFDLDGFVLHSNRSCKPYSLGQQVIRKELADRTGKPGLIIEADMADERYYDRKRVSEQIATFMEVLS
jgi:benzoyl-CoA reductase/2-hydroxyglutaryl-CoA dehydratase subunit BcrC/BadD/HgdB